MDGRHGARCAARGNHPTRTLGQLFRLAREAHACGERWAIFWPTVAADVVHMAGGDLVKRRRLVDRLLSVLVSGETSGLEPPTSDVWGEHVKSKSETRFVFGGNGNDT